VPAAARRGVNPRRLVHHVPVTGRNRDPLRGRELSTPERRLVRGHAACSAEFQLLR
jgi:hypothetical protein